MDNNLKAALQLVTELQHLNGADELSKPDQTPALRVEVYTADGRFAGEALLNPRAAEEAANATSAAAGFALAMPERYQAGREAAPAPTPDPDLDPRNVADIEDMFADIDPDSYLADVFGGPDAEASLVAFEQMVTGTWDGQL